MCEKTFKFEEKSFFKDYMNSTLLAFNLFNFLRFKTQNLGTYKCEYTSL